MLASRHAYGMHGRPFDLSAWLKRQGFEHVSRTGKTNYGAVFADKQWFNVTINPNFVLGDVVAHVCTATISSVQL
jgi:hypothetical protein